MLLLFRLSKCKMSHRRAISISYGFQTLQRVCSSSAKTPNPSPFLEERHGYCYMQKFFLLNVKLKWHKDRALDHVVERERDAKSVVALKDIVKKQPGACLPVDAVSKKNRELGLKIRVSRFLRKYPSIFEEYAAQKTNLPWFRLSKEALALEEEEDRIHRQHESDNAEKLCKLLMMTRPKQLHLDLIDELKWDLGLPDNYVQSLVPNYPDYFSIVNMPDNRPGLDLVCWNNELAVSTLEKRASSVGKYRKGMALAFPMNFSKGHEMKQKVVKWLQAWQKLPYISPYEDASHLDPNSDLGEKRVIGVLHELLCLMVNKKVHRRTILSLREPMGLPHKFVRCFSRHPGIFYQSMKNGVITIILREAFKRAELAEAHPLVTLRGKYIHLMVKGMEDRKKGLYKKGQSQQKDSVDDDDRAQKKVDCDKHPDENKESQEEESSDDSKYDERLFSEDETETETETEDEDDYEDDDEEDEDDDDEEDEDDDEEDEDEDDDDNEGEAIGKEVRTSRRRSGNFMPSSRQATILQSRGSRDSKSKPPGIKGGSLRIPKWEDSRERASGRKGSRFETSGTRNNKLQTSDRRGSHFETSGNPGRKFNSRTYGVKDSSLSAFKGEDSNKKASGRRGSSFEVCGRQNNKLQKSDRRSSHFETSDNPGSKFNSKTYGAKDGSLRNSKREDCSKQTSRGQGSSFETSMRRNSKLQAYGRQGSDFKTSGNPDRDFNSKKSGIKDDSLRTSKWQDSSKLTSARQGSSFKTSGRQNSKSQTSGRRGSDFEISGNPGGKFEASGKQGKKFEMSRNRDVRFK